MMKLKQFMFALVAMVLGFAMPTFAQTSVSTLAELKDALANSTNIVVNGDVAVDEAITIPSGTTVGGDGSLHVQTKVYVVSTETPYPGVTYNKTATKNGAILGAVSCGVVYEISLDGGENWFTDTTNGQAQAVTVHKDGTKTISTSFQSAFTSAKCGEVVHMLKDAHVQSTNTSKNNGPLRSYYGLILEGNGHTIYTDLESSGASNEYATIKFTSYLAGTGADVRPVLKNVTINSQNNAKADLDLVSGDVTFTVSLYNVNLLGKCQYASFPMTSKSITINKSNVKLYDSQIPSWDAGSANAIEFYSGEYSLSCNSKCKVYGGTFTKNPSNYLASCAQVKQENGKYVVSYKKAEVKVEVAPSDEFESGATEEEKAVANELATNTAVSSAIITLPVGVNDFEVQLTDIETTNEATTKVTFNVEPKDASGAKVSNPSEAITFRLPVPATWSGEANVYHEGTLLGAYTIKEESGAKYVEVSSSSFSEFSVEAIVPTEVEVATLAELQAALADNSNELPIIITETIVIPEGETVVLDLNGKTVTRQDEANQYALRNLGDLTIKDTKGNGSINARGIYNGYGDGSANVATAKITVLSGTINAKGTNGGAAVYNYGIAEIKGGTFTSIGGYSLNNQVGASMTIADGVTANNGIYASNATLVVNGGEINGNRSGCHVLYAWNSAVTINGGTFYNYNSGNSTIMAAGTTKLTIEDGTFGIKDGRVPGDGNTWTSCLTDTQNSAEMTVNGGTFNGGFRVQAGTSMTIKGGSFNDVYGSNYNIYGTVTVTGGTFTDPTAKAFATKYVAEGYELNEGTVEKIVVAKIGDVEYATLSAAFAAVTDDNQTVVILQDVTENLTAALRGNITTENGAKVTITLANTGWVYCPYTFVIGENVTLNLPQSGLFYYAGGSVINGTVVSDAYYQRYAGTKLTINEPGSMTVTSETCIIRYMDGDPNAGIYINGDNDSETVGLKLAVAYFYQGMINAKDANIVAGTYWQTNETDGQGSANLVLDNSTLTVTVYDHPAKATGNSTVTLTNGSVLDARNGGFTYGDNTALSVDATSKIIGKNGEVVKFPVASIGDVKYYTLEEAFKAATSGCTIEILSDVTVDYNWDARNTGAKFTVPVTINGNDKTVKFTASVNDNNYQAPFRFEADATVKNLTIDMSETTDSRFRAISAKGNLTVDGCEFIGKDATLNCRAIIFGEGAGTNVGNLAISVTNSEFRNWKRGITDNENGQDVKSATITGNTLTNAAVYVSAKENVTFTGNTVSGAYVDIRSYTANNSLNVTATGNTLEENTATDYNYIKNAGGTINQEGFVLPPVAQVGEVKYATLEEAVAAAQADNIITMLADATLSAELTLPAGITLNGNGKQINGNIVAAGDLTIAGHTKVTNFNAGYNKPTITIGEGACLELTGTGRMVIGHGATFNITGTITDAKTANVADLTPSLIMAGASFTGAGVTFNVTNAYVNAPSSYCSTSKTASGTFDFNITNSIWKSAGKLAFEEQSVNAKVDFALVNSVLTTGSHLVFGTASGEEGVVIDNSNVNVGTSRQIENCGTMTIKNGSVVNGAVATSSNSKNPGIVIVENATYAVTGEFSGSDLGTGTIIVKKGATVSASSITKANIVIDAADMTAGELANFTANLSNLAGTLEVINNVALEAKIVDGKIVLVEKTLAGEGTEVNPYLIKTADDLVLFRNSVNKGETKYNAEGKYVALGANIDLAGIDWSVNIGDDCNATFDGIFDGKNYTISNLTATETAQKGDGYICTGLFGAIYGNAVVKNLTLKNVTIDAPYAGNNVAAVVGFGYNAKGSIENVHVTGDIDINAPNATGVGAILGYDYACTALKVENCEVKGNDGSAIVGKAYVGGVVGYASSKIALNENTVENVSVTGTASVGAIAGIMLAGGSADGNTVKNVALSATGDLWANSVAVVAGTITKGSVTAANTTVENVTVNGEEAPIVGGVLVEQPTTPIEKVQAKIGNVYFATIDAAMKASNVDGEVAILTDVTIDDAEAKEYTYNKEAEVMGTLTYKRTLPLANFWMPLYVPFALPMSQDFLDKYDVAYFYDVSVESEGYQNAERTTIALMKVTNPNAVLKANYPLVIRAKSAEAQNMELTFTGAKLQPAVENAVTFTSLDQEYVVMGTYKKHSALENNQRVLGMADGKANWGVLTEGYSLNPYRLILTITSRENADLPFQTIGMRLIGEDGITYIDDVKQSVEVGDNFIYDLQGRRVIEPTKGGIYIINGKKVYFK